MCARMDESKCDFLQKSQRPTYCTARGPYNTHSGTPLPRDIHRSVRTVCCQRQMLVRPIIWGECNGGLSTSGSFCLFSSLWFAFKNRNRCRPLCWCRGSTDSLKEGRISQCMTCVAAASSWSSLCSSPPCECASSSSRRLISF